MCYNDTHYWHLAIELQKILAKLPHPRDARIEAIRPISSVLCSEDFWQLQDHRRRCESDGAHPRPLMAAYLRAKLEDAQVVEPEDHPQAAANGNSSVTCRINHGPAATYRLYHWIPPPAGRPLGVNTWLGATLIGMTEGQCATLFQPNGSACTVSLEVTVPAVAAGDYRRGVMPALGLSR